MIDYIKCLSEMIMCCDNCQEEDTAVGEWYECIQIFKQRGWNIFKDRLDEWTHDCPDCVKGPTAEEDFK